MAEHRVTTLGSPRRLEDPTRSPDPAVRAVLAGLRTLEVAPPPQARFRAELRAQLVAVTPRLVAEGVEAEHSVAPGAGTALVAPAREKRSLRDVLRIPVGRSLGIATACVAVLAMLLGGTVLLSRHALPGDALYGVKRTSENVELATASGPTDKAGDLLSFAHTRLDEIGELLAADGSSPTHGVSTDTAKLVTSTLASADSDLRQATRLLTALAVQRHSLAALKALLTWAPGQLQRLRTTLARVPTGSLYTRVGLSIALVRAALTRIGRFEALLASKCFATPRSDSLGPVPASRCATAPHRSAPAHVQPRVTTSTAHPSRHATTHPTPTTPARTHPTATSAPATTGTTTAPVTTAPTSRHPAPRHVLPTSAPATSPVITLPVKLPSVSISVPVPSVGTDSCGLTASAGPLHIGIGSCGLSVGTGP